MKTLIVIITIVIANLLLYISAFCDSNIYPDDKIWNEVLTPKSDAISDLVKKMETGEAPAWLKDYAPLVWLHPNEKFPPTDPDELLEHTQLAYRELYPGITFLNREFVNLGPFNNYDLQHAKYKNATPTDVVTRIFENGSVTKGLGGFELIYDPTITMNNPAPVFWRLGKNPLFAKIQPKSSDEIFLPVEFWYHYNFNRTGIWIANHEGDWESSLILLKLRIENANVTVSRYMVSPTAHGGSHWFCDKNLAHTDQHVEFFSAVGTHATYSDDSIHWRGPYPDRTGKGHAWETWNLMKPVVKEKFYGYSGSWGASTYIHFQTAPIAPGPKFKYLPAQMNLNTAILEYNTTSAECNSAH